MISDQLVLHMLLQGIKFPVTTLYQVSFLIVRRFDHDTGGSQKRRAQPTLILNSFQAWHYNESLINHVAYQYFFCWMNASSGIAFWHKFIEKQPLVSNSGLTICQWVFVHLMPVQWGWLKPGRSYSMTATCIFCFATDLYLKPVKMLFQLNNKSVIWPKLSQKPRGMSIKERLATHWYLFAFWSATMNSMYLCPLEL